MFERYTERAREVVKQAQVEAQGFSHGSIGTEHLLAALLKDEEGLAGRVLSSLGLTLDDVRVDIVRIVGYGDSLPAELPFTPRAKKVLELALREALSLGHNYIGTEHLLLGLVRENKGVAMRILLDYDIDQKKVREEVLRQLSGPSPKTPAVTRHLAPAICYHPKRHAWNDYSPPNQQHLKCLDCQAEVSSAYNVPLPELVPMPVTP